MISKPYYQYIYSQNFRIINLFPPTGSDGMLTSKIMDVNTLYLILRVCGSVASAQSLLTVRAYV